MSERKTGVKEKMDYKEILIEYLRDQSWNSASLEMLVEDWEGPMAPLIIAATQGRKELMMMFDPYLSKEDCEIAADLICPVQNNR